jgi:uncharacterized protein DUF6998
LKIAENGNVREVAVDGSGIERLPDLIGDLFRIVDNLTKLFPEKPFTPDGHLVGSIGEVMAAYLYGLRLEKSSNLGFDATTSEWTPVHETRRKVEIKLTGSDRVSVSSDFTNPPDVLLVFKLDRNTGFTEIYNGPFPRDLCSRLIPSKRHVVQLSIRTLQQKCPPPECKPLKPVNGRSLHDLNRLFPNITPDLG